MNGFSCLMIIFGVLIFLAGLYIYTGHKNPVLLWKVYNLDTISKKELQNIGKWTMISSIIPFLLSILGFFIEV
ncbi:MAG: hypothetical protein IJG68_00890 [Bacilli bacterium]|nr:hypothetical protein [Bacilli bacterium]